MPARLHTATATVTVLCEGCQRRFPAQQLYTNAAMGISREAWSVCSAACYVRTIPIVRAQAMDHGLHRLVCTVQHPALCWRCARADLQQKDTWMLRTAFATIRRSHRDYPAQFWHADGLDGIANTLRATRPYSRMTPIYGDPAYTEERPGDWRGITIAYHPAVIRITIDPAWVVAMAYVDCHSLAGLPLSVLVALGFRPQETYRMPMDADGRYLLEQEYIPEWEHP